MARNGILENYLHHPKINTHLKHPMIQQNQIFIWSYCLLDNSKRSTTKCGKPYVSRSLVNLHLRRCCTYWMNNRKFLRIRVKALQRIWVPSENHIERSLSSTIDHTVWNPCLDCWFVLLTFPSFLKIYQAPKRITASTGLLAYQILL
jgi:hypothetical protein